MIGRLIDEHWQAAAVAAVRNYCGSDSQRWADQAAEADEATGADAPVTDGRSSSRGRSGRPASILPTRISARLWRHQ